jgi:hypothetical protein
LAIAAQRAKFAELEGRVTDANARLTAICNGRYARAREMARWAWI